MVAQSVFMMSFHYKLLLPKQQLLRKRLCAI
jgi:hypothetical protein